jgi:hypothetical protein
MTLTWATTYKLFTFILWLQANLSIDMIHILNFNITQKAQSLTCSKQTTLYKAYMNNSMQ